MSHISGTGLGMIVHLKTDYETALTLVADALKVEGFGVLTEIDIKETFKKKLDMDFYPYKILGACNPSLSHRALTAAPEVGLLLPCNVTVRQLENGQIDVAIVNPLEMLAAVSHPAVRQVALEAREKLVRVVRALDQFAG